MSLTGEQITAGKTYTVTINKRELSHKRFSDAVKRIKGIGEREDHSAAYDPATQAWTVVLPADSFWGLDDLRTLASAYGAEVTEGAPKTTATSVMPRGSETRRASRQYGTDMAEYADGFSPEERRAFGGR